MPPVRHPFDQLHGTDTSGLIPGTIIARGTTTPAADLTAYYAIAPSILHAAIDLWLHHAPLAAPIQQTVFLDIGAGKGRALLLASQHPFLRVEGVELNASLARIAAANIALWQRNHTTNAITLHHANATTHPLPPEPTLAFLFHPFELPILRHYLRHIEKSLTANPQTFDLLYINTEHGPFLDRHPAFTRLWSGPITMTPEDHRADLAAIAQQKDYGSTGDELCALYRFTGRQPR